MNEVSDVTCLKCHLSLEGFDENDVKNHLGACGFTSDAATQYGLTEAGFFCVMCDEDLSRRSVISRCRHLKTCRRKNRVAVKDLLAIVAPVEECNLEEQQEGGAADDEIVCVEEAHSLPKNDENMQPTEKVNAFAFMMSASKSHASVACKGAAKGKATPFAAKSKFGKDLNSNYIKDTAFNQKLKGRKKRGGGMFSRKLNEAGEVAYPPNYKLVRHPRFRHTPIVVDGFQYATPALSDCYFLTHFHADHYGGLDGNFSSGRIFCTPTTAALVKLKLKPAKGHVIPLEFERDYDIPVGGISVKVTMLKANHCPGAACILFRFQDGRHVLHVGDFRWDTQELLTPGSLYSKLRKTALDGVNKQLTVYLDTTYCSEEHSFPPQREAIERVVQAVKEQVKRGGHPLFVFGAYGIGKERVYMSVADAMGWKVHTDKARRRMMMCYDWSPSNLAKITVDPSEAPIWVVSMGHLNFNVLENTMQKASPLGYDRIVAFRPTGWSFKGSSACIEETKKGDRLTLCSVPYSEHSSFSELIEFVNLFKPSVIIPTVNTSKEAVAAQLNTLRRKSSAYL